MSDKVFFDTDILLYTIGQDDVRTPTAEALLANGGLISVTLYSEDLKSGQVVDGRLTIHNPFTAWPGRPPPARADASTHLARSAVVVSQNNTGRA